MTKEEFISSVVSDLHRNKAHKDVLIPASLKFGEHDFYNFIEVDGISSIYFYRVEWVLVVDDDAVVQKSRLARVRIRLQPTNEQTLYLYENTKERNGVVSTLVDMHDIMGASKKMYLNE